MSWVMLTMSRDSDDSGGAAQRLSGGQVSWEALGCGLGRRVIQMNA